MARPKIIRKAEEARDIDPNLPIQVELPPEGHVELSADDIAKQAKAEEEDRVVAEQQKRDAEEDGREEEVKSLKQQIEDLKKASEEHRRMAQEAAQRETEARKLVTERDTELKTMNTRADQAQYDSVVNAIGGLESEIARASQEAEAAAAAQDWPSFGKANAAVARASGRLTSLEEAKAGLEERAEAAKNKKDDPAPAASGDPIQAHIDSIPGLLPAQRKWLGEHRELMTDSKKNVRLQNAHIDADEAGLTAGSEAYFKFMEERLGYRKAEVKASVEDDNDEPTQERPPIMGAPPSRDPPSAGSGQPRPTRITLTAEQRSAAQAAGVDEVTYAKQLLKLQELKKTGHYNEH